MNPLSPLISRMTRITSGSAGSSFVNAYPRKSAASAGGGFNLYFLLPP